MSLSTYVPHGIAGVSAIIAMLSFQQSSELSVADYAERIRSNELSIQSSAERLQETAGDLEQLAGRIEDRQAQREIEALQSQVDNLQSQIKALQDRPAGSSVSAEQIAALLARDYADQLRGPAGPKGDTGPTGPKGKDGVASAGTTGHAAAQVVIDDSFTSNYEEQYAGEVKVTLPGC